jgi:hypothetical protein
MADDAQDPDSLADIGGLQRDGLLLLSYLAETPNRPLISPAVGGAEGVDLQCFIKAPEAIADDAAAFAALVRSVDLLGRAAAPANAASVRLTRTFLFGPGPTTSAQEVQSARQLRRWTTAVRLGLLVAAVIAIGLLLKVDQGRRIVGQLSQVRGDLDRSYSELAKLDRAQDFQAWRYEVGQPPDAVPNDSRADRDRPASGTMELCWPLDQPAERQYRLLPAKPQAQALCSQLVQQKLRERLIYARIQLWNCDMVRLNPVHWPGLMRAAPGLDSCGATPPGLHAEDWKRTELRTAEVAQGISGYLLPLLLGGIGGGVYVVRRQDEALRSATLAANDGVAAVGRIVLAATFGGLLAMVFSTDEPVRLGSISLTIAAWAFFLGYALETVLKTLDAAIEGVVGKLRPVETEKQNVPVSPR